VCWAPPPAIDDTALPTASPDDRISIGFRAFTADAITGRTEVTEGFSLRYRDIELIADGASFARAEGDIDVLGNVTLQNDELSLSAEGARFDRTTEVFTLPFASFELREQNARGQGEDIRLGPDRVLSLNNLFFTTCPADDLDWQLTGRRLVLDPEAGFGTARNVKLIFKRVPILWTPYFSFPIDDRRKSGFLTPRLAERDRTGFDLTVPYYLNIRPNYDLLLEPRYMSDRGTMLRSAFRYLMPQSEGRLTLENLPDDRVIDQSRHYANLSHESLFGEHWRLLTGIEDVSDPAYFEDLGDTLGVISQTHLARYVDLGFLAPRWSFATRVQEYQTIDTLIEQIDRPYERLPQLVFRGRWGRGLVGYESAAEAIKFDRTIGATGWRFDSTQELSLRLAGAGMYLTPAVAFRQTSYRLDAAELGSARSLSRGVPITSVDTGMRFERETGRGRSWIQTIEPRLLYVNVPFEDQSDLPVFDTIVPDFNLVQLFRKYQFVGADRVADTDQVSVGLTTRLIESSSGRERVAATVGQTRYRDPRRVMLPEEAALGSTRSNYVAELGLALSASWNLDIGYQWDGETDSTVRAETRFEFRPRDDRLFGLGYRQREGLLEQGDLSVIWPVGERWRLIGQYSYSLLEKKPLERLAGLEYEACCWLIRLTNRSYIVRSSGETDSTFSIELRLKGLSRGGATPEELLGRGILGYRRLDQNPAP
jgi:LPS-assembly protein